MVGEGKGEGDKGGERETRGEMERMLSKERHKRLERVRGEWEEREWGRDVENVRERGTKRRR